jgi:hypothetical protein
MTTRRSWIQNFCEDSNWPVDEKHAEGLLKLHATCAPPCPRKLSAERWLREHVADDEQEGPAAWLERADGTWHMVDDLGLPSKPFKVVDGRAVPVDDITESTVIVT